MDNEPLYRVSDLCRISGAASDAAVFWIREGLLQSADVEARKHRRFSRREVKIAALLREARDFGMNVAVMRDMIAQLRRALAIYDGLDIMPYLPDMLGDAANEEDYMINSHEAQGRISSDHAEALRSMRRKLTRQDASKAWIAFNFESGEGPIYLLRNRAGELQLATSMDDRPGADLRSAIFFNMDEIGNLSWPEGGEDERAS